MEINSSKTSAKDNKMNEDDIDLKALIKFLIRNKKFIFLLSFISSLLGLFYSFIATPIFKGNFQIVVNEKTNNTIRSSTINPIQILKGNQNNKTQEFILRSPSVLRPVYEILKKNHFEKSKKKYISFQEWEDTLKIEFEYETDVLNIDYENANKELIITTLSLISKEYQNYSKSNRKKNLDRTFKFLSKQQKILKENSLKSMQKLNKFSIDNGLGDIDGFVSLGPSTTMSSMFPGLLNENIPNQNIIGNFQNTEFEQEQFNKNNEAGQRFTQQFQLLEQYEASYVNLSSKLKPNSKVLSDIKSKINNLRNSLKRPSEIIITYKELAKISQRDEYLLNKVRDELELTKLEISKQQDPWDLISEPTIDELRVWPKRKIIVIYTFFLGLILGSLLSFYKERKKGTIYELNQLKKIINCNFLEILYLKNGNISFKILQSKLNEKLLSNGAQNSPVCLADSLSIKNNPNLDFEKSIKLDSNFKYVSNLNDDIGSYKKIVFLVTQENITEKEIFLINKYITIYNEQVIGWFFIDWKTIF